jgi:phosphatidylinositol kinase/protein kinase (PI-3  family)
MPWPPPCYMRQFSLSLSVCVCVRARRLWGKAQELYMAAQTKARSGTLPFAEGEYLLWEEHWLK